MAKSPAFQFYAKDWLADTRELGPYGRGVLVDMIALCWENGSIADEPETVAHAVGADPKQVAKLWKMLREKFGTDDGRPGRLFNMRLEVEREKQEEYRAVQSAKGKLSAESRARARVAQRFNRGSNTGSTAASTPVDPDGNRGSNTGSTGASTGPQPEPQPEGNSASASAVLHTLRAPARSPADVLWYQGTGDLCADGAALLELRHHVDAVAEQAKRDPDKLFSDAIVAYKAYRETCSTDRIPALSPRKLLAHWPTVWERLNGTAPAGRAPPPPPPSGPDLPTVAELRAKAKAAAAGGGGAS